MQELHTPYDGTSEAAQRNKFARDNIKKIFYYNDNTFTFENYVTKLKLIFNVLKRYGVTLFE